MTPFEQVKLRFLQLQAGIIPTASRFGEEGMCHHDFTRILAMMSPDEARRMKRKFRKLWRKIAARAEAHPRTGKRTPQEVGYHNPQPTRKHKTERKWRVSAAFMAAVRKGSV